MPASQPQRVSIRARDGLALAALHWPAPPSRPGLVVVHGAGSRKERHTGFAGRAHERGMAVIALDLRGHGESAPAPVGPELLGDVLAGLDRLAESGHGALAVRGSSLGGFLALHAGAEHLAVRAVAALCPAWPAGLAARYDAGWPLRMPLEPTLDRRPGLARGYWHAVGDELVPWGYTFALAQRSPQPRLLRVRMGGDHTSLQGDPTVHDETIAFLLAHLG